MGTGGEKLMAYIRDYMDLPYDLAGSMAKNRFRYELLWGLIKMLNLFKDEKKFMAVFDYVCDVEVHLDKHLEFYQLKTSNKNGSYTINKLTKIEKNKTRSILGNLYRLKLNTNLSENEDTRVYIVSNSPLKDDETLYTECEEVSLTSIDENSKKTIKKLLKVELNTPKEISLDNSYFIRTNMNLVDPKSEIIGHLAILFEEKLKCKCKSLTSLYNVLSSEVFNRACYELKIDSYEGIIKNKGFTYYQLEEILNKYIEISDNSIENTKKFINNNFNVGKRIKFLQALKCVVIGLNENKTLQTIEVEIVEYINRNQDVLDNSEIEIIKIVKKEIYNKKTIEISDNEIEVLILLTLKRFEEGVYE